MTVRVRLFAILREWAGSEWLELELRDGATVADALRAVEEQPPLAELMARLPVQLAVNRDYAASSTPLSPGDELALIPPLSGGAEDGAAKRVHARLTDQPLSLESISRAVADSGAGAIAIFEGVTREVQRLEYEAYREMAEDRLATIAQECLEVHGLLACAVEHRVGGVPLGEPSVIVAASAAHRAPAFAGAREAIDRLKQEVPIWKREVAGDGDARWVDGVPAASAFSHIDERGRARMVDVGGKATSARVARARALVRMSPATATLVAEGNAPKGEVLSTARLAGIQAAKGTGHLIPLAHPLELTYIDLDARVDERSGVVELTSEVRTVGRTGVEMEAMTACAIAALTVYDMVKGVERGVVIEQVVLLEKTGGRSDWRLGEEMGVSAAEAGGHERAER